MYLYNNAKYLATFIFIKARNHEKIATRPTSSFLFTHPPTKKKYYPSSFKCEQHYVNSCVILFSYVMLPHSHDKHRAACQVACTPKLKYMHSFFFNLLRYRNIHFSHGGRAGNAKISRMSFNAESQNRKLIKIPPLKYVPSLAIHFIYNYWNWVTSLQRAKRSRAGVKKFRSTFNGTIYPVFIDGHIVDKNLIE